MEVGIPSYYCILLPIMVITLILTVEMERDQVLKTVLEVLETLKNFPWTFGYVY